MSHAQRRKGARLRSIAIALSVSALVAHMSLTAVFNVPWANVKYDMLPGAVADAYVRPYLVQDYKIFAPEPAHADVSLWVRAWVRDESGDTRTTGWIDATAGEVSSSTRKIMRKHPTVVAAERLLGAYSDLDEAARRVVAADYHRDSDLAGLRDDLAGSGTSSDVRRAFIRASNFATSFASQAAFAVWGESADVLAVQVRAVSSPVVRWADRFETDAARPDSTVTLLGWRPIIEWRDQSREGFARTFDADGGAQ